MMQRIAFILIGGGGLTALGFFIKWLFFDPLNSLVFKIVSGMVMVGILLLFILVIRDRYLASKGEEEEKFKEVKY